MNFGYGICWFENLSFLLGNWTKVFEKICDYIFERGNRCIIKIRILYEQKIKSLSPSLFLRVVNHFGRMSHFPGRELSFRVAFLEFCVFRDCRKGEKYSLFTKPKLLSFPRFDFSSDENFSSLQFWWGWAGVGKIGERRDPNFNPWMKIYDLLGASIILIHTPVRTVFEYSHFFEKHFFHFFKILIIFHSNSLFWQSLKLFEKINSTPTQNQ